VGVLIRLKIGNFLNGKAFPMATLSPSPTPLPTLTALLTLTSAPGINNYPGSAPLPPSRWYHAGQIVAFFATVLSFWLLFVWPAIKTLARVHSQTPGHLGRWGLYWIASPFLYLIFAIFHLAVKYWPWVAIIQVIVSVILSFGNGSLVHIFSEKVIAKIYQKNYNSLKKLPELMETGIGLVLRLPFRLLSILLKGQEEGK
jgi:hypothetical protein